MAQTSERHTVSFVVRLWAEPARASGESHWRGQIEHVGSGQTTHFQVPAALLEFLQTHFPANVEIDPGIAPPYPDSVLAPGGSPHNTAS
ncbi:MAG: hypothetical protein KKA73_08730 [Chloroflexi bacterium]|nr:hypothetical protein [Chloroflexota bacterium]MBU1747762.1 hypothetical protein [Chloroflexota bacterium]